MLEAKEPVGIYSNVLTVRGLARLASKNIEVATHNRNKLKAIESWVQEVKSENEKDR